MLGLVFAVISLVFTGPMMGFIAGTMGIFAFVIIAFVITIEFVIGTIIGDFLENQKK